jgi:hypothetical protein
MATTSPDAGGNSPKFRLAIPGAVLICISVSEQIVSLIANANTLWTRFQLDALTSVLTSGWARLGYLMLGLALIWLSTRRPFVAPAAPSPSSLAADIEFVTRFWADGLETAYGAGASLLEAVLQDYEFAYPPAGHLVRWLYWQLQNERYQQASRLLAEGRRSSRLDLMFEGCAKLYLVLLESDLWLKQLIPVDLEDHNGARYHQYAPFRSAMQTIARQFSYEIKDRPALHRLSILMSEAKEAAKGPNGYPG